VQNAHSLKTAETLAQQHGGDRRSEDISSGQVVLLKTADTMAKQ
jgi:hypothetical protein